MFSNIVRVLRSFQKDKNSTWTDLVERFHKLSHFVRRTKGSSFQVAIECNPNGEWQVSLGTYDFADYPRITVLPICKSEQEALESFERKVKELEEHVQRNLRQGGDGFPE